MRPACSVAWIGILLVTLSGCAVTPPTCRRPSRWNLAACRRQMSLSIFRVWALHRCARPQRAPQLAPAGYVLVHGCKGSAGRFRSLAQLYAFHGQQAVCSVTTIVPAWCAARAS